MNYKNIANAVIENVGGKENIASAAHCVTRLRLVLKDTTKYNKEIIENIEGVKLEYFLMEVNYKLYLEQKL
ncbi:MAG: PTS transporter subunit EIIB [Romboutsia timonensis]